MSGNIDFDIEKVESIVYTQEYVPEPEDFDVNDYNSEEEMKEDMLHSYSFYIENFDDSFGEHLNYRGVEMDYDDVEYYFGEDIAQSMVKNEGISRGGSSKEITIGANTTPKSMSLKDIDDVAKRVLPITDYFKGCRGFILYDGTIVATEAEHNMCTIIDGVKNTFHFIELGNIRILNQSVDLAKEPTPQQRQVLMQVINSYSDGDFYLDIMTGDNIGVHYYEPDYRRVLADIDRYFSDGIKPKSEQMFECVLNESKEETTFYRFYSEIRAFLNKLLKSPIKAKPNKYLEDRGFTRKRLIKLLHDNDIIKRDEKIMVPGKDDVKHVMYSVKYTLKSEAFENKIEKIYKKYFPDDKNIKEGIIKRRIMESIFKEKTSMSKKVIFNEQQLRHIAECNGFNADDLLEATTCASVGASTTRGDMGYDTPGFATSKDKKFWGSSLNHQTPKTRRVGKDLNENVDEDWKSAAVGAAMGAASLFGGGNAAKAATAEQAPTQNVPAKTIQAPTFYTEEQLIKIFPQAYKDKDQRDPAYWQRNRVNYEGMLPNGKVSFIGREAAKNGQNPWDAILRRYLKRENAKTYQAHF